MGSITVIIIVFMFAIVGIKEFLIVLAVGGILGIISAIVQSAEQRRENKYKQYYDSNTNNQSYRNDKEQTDNTLVIDMMKQEEPEINDLKVDDSNWESDCESCEKLLEDCECDWQDISREDTSQSEWNDKDSSKRGTSFDNFGG